MRTVYGNPHYSTAGQAIRPTRLEAEPIGMGEKLGDSLILLALFLPQKI